MVCLSINDTMFIDATKLKKKKQTFIIAVEVVHSPRIGTDATKSSTVMP